MNFNNLHALAATVIPQQSIELDKGYFDIAKQRINDGLTTRGTLMSNIQDVCEPIQVKTWTELQDALSSGQPVDLCADLSADDADYPYQVPDKKMAKSVPRMLYRLLVRLGAKA